MITNRRGILQDIRSVRTGFSRRLKIHISTTEASARNVAPGNPFTGTAPPDESTDTIQRATGVWSEIKPADEYDSFGKQTTRKGFIDCHPMFEPYFKKSYAVEIIGEPGRFKVVGTKLDTARSTVRVAVESMDS